MARRSSLRARLLRWALVYLVVVTAAVVIGGEIVNEHAERQVWRSLMRSDLQHFVERRRADPGYNWIDDPAEHMYFLQRDANVPPALARLKPGLHDDFLIGGIKHVVLVEDTQFGRLALALDLTRFEGVEGWVTFSTVMTAAVAIIIFGLLMALGLGRAVQPLSAMARQIAGLRPDATQARIDVPADASEELRVIGEAFNGYLERNARFVERERAFIDSASHELRTPVAVIAGANDLALEHPELPPAVRAPLLRVRRTARKVEQLISLLLVLAKDPSRLTRNADLVALQDLIPEVVADHQHLTEGRDLELVVAPMTECVIHAPLAIVQAAIGNLLRNAVENSDRGRIEVGLEPGATVVIRDPGHGMSPEEISAVYSRMARGGGRDGGGIGLDLIARLCEHLGWQLRIESDLGRGTVARLRFCAED
ncbi:HAMP domain-containing sensor histidine kinase [Pseudoxanthomonas sp. X-1]|jgi:signal transduction histidine kinase|uniref:sensor histidine kinase n=1 Tax=Pseudoxanthomonas sp. X-1 TaxID=2571115 RepID=UPI00110A4966|nr:HAMP domain-containing sensor histidine kinase [Pseudoxanthomonas sp. X-1]TMN18762.1 HAMP domain-containing histidine kinase [Pseudoxanthomonas sp. X-1]UAY74478.1 HAMP domain-containing histidine kinase [Pseudoxanthomonas sp. X-1]HCH0556723.1 HAMP domain-containing histidine kinase [Pseudomonas aeruginosa]